MEILTISYIFAFDQIHLQESKSGDCKYSKRLWHFPQMPSLKWSFYPVPSQSTICNHTSIFFVVEIFCLIIMNVLFSCPTFCRHLLLHLLLHNCVQLKHVFCFFYIKFHDHESHLDSSTSWHHVT